MVNSCFSQLANVTSDEPQGSVLGPLLFLLYVNDLPKAMNCLRTSVRLFADDAILYRPFLVKVFRPSYAEWLIELKLGNCSSMLANAHQLPCSLLNSKTSAGLNPHLLKTLFCLSGCACMSFIGF